jgi:transcriptional regulator with XRE-family HTH domain
MAKKGQAQEGPQPEEGSGLLDQIRDAIRKSGRTLNQMEKDTGVSRGELSRFLRRQRVLGGEPLERICRALGLHLTGKARRE